MSQKSRGSYRTAIGLDYSEAAETVPSVSVKGDALTADEVVQLARRFGIPIVEDEDLASSLDFLEVDEPIPPKLFSAVALILSSLKRRFGGL